MVTRNSSSKLNRLFNALFLALVLALPLNTEVFAAYGPNAPVLEGTYADSMISANDIWHIYLKGSDPDGDLKFIHVWFNVPGMPTTPIRLRIDRDQGSSVSGYLKFFNTKSLNFSDLFVYPFSLSVSLEDRMGHRSKVIDLPVSFYRGAEQDHAPSGAFEDRFLGRIPKMVFPHGIGI